MEDAFLVCVYQSNVFWKIYKIEFEYLGVLKNNARGRLHLFVVLNQQAVTLVKLWLGSYLEQ